MTGCEHYWLNYSVVLYNRLHIYVNSLTHELGHTQAVVDDGNMNECVKIFPCLRIYIIYKSLNKKYLDPLPQGDELVDGSWAVYVTSNKEDFLRRLPLLLLLLQVPSRCKSHDTGKSYSMITEVIRRNHTAALVLLL